MDENITDIATVIIATCALLVTTYQIYTTRKHNRLAVRPLIQIGWTTNEKIDGIWLRNVGLGPAIITKFTISHKGKILTTKEIAEHLHEMGYTSGMYVAGFGSTIQTTDLKWLVESEKNLDSSDKIKEYWGLLEGLLFTVEYKCFYNTLQPKVFWECPNPLRKFVTVKTKLD